MLCSCGGLNGNCYRCNGRGYYGEEKSRTSERRRGPTRRSRNQLCNFCGRRFANVEAHIAAKHRETQLPAAVESDTKLNPGLKRITQRESAEQTVFPQVNFVDVVTSADGSGIDGESTRAEAVSPAFIPFNSVQRAIILRLASLYKDDLSRVCQDLWPAERPPQNGRFPKTDALNRIVTLLTDHEDSSADLKRRAYVLEYLERLGTFSVK